MRKHPQAAPAVRENPRDVRNLANLAGVGKKTLEDFRDLEIDSVDALAQQDP